MKKRNTGFLLIAFWAIVWSTALVILALSTLTGLAQTEDDGYPAPIDYGYPIGYPVIDPYPVEYGYPIDIGYPIIPSYPDPIGYPAIEVVSEPTFAEEWEAEVVEFEQVIKQPKQVAGHDIRVTVKQLIYIVQYYGKMLFLIR